MSGVYLLGEGGEFRNYSEIAWLRVPEAASTRANADAVTGLLNTYRIPCFPADAGKIPGTK